MASTAANRNASDIAALAPVMTHLLHAAISDGTKQANRRAILTCVDFSKMLFLTYHFLPASVCVLAAFIASLYSRHLITYISVLSYIHTFWVKLIQPSFSL